jgi:hypothetical protein
VPCILLPVSIICAVLYATVVGPSPKTCAPVLCDSVSYVENHNPIYVYIRNIIPIGYPLGDDYPAGDPVPSGPGLC